MSCPVPRGRIYQKDSTKRLGTTGALAPKIWILMNFRLSPGLIYYKDIENMKSLKAKYGHPFVYKPHNLCLEEAYVVCATTLIENFLNGGGYSVFYMKFSGDFPL